MPSTIWHIGGEDIRLRIPLLQILREKGFKVGAVGSESGHSFKNYGIDYYYYPLAKGLNPLADLRSICSLKNLFRNHPVDIVHAFDTKPAFLVPLAANNSKKQCVARTIPGLGSLFSSRSPYALALRPIYCYLQRNGSRLSDITIFQNRQDAAHYLDHKMVSNSKHRIIFGSGVDLNNFTRVRIDEAKIAALRQELNIRNRIVVILVARIIPHKGIEEYLESAQIIIAHHPDTCFLLVGPPGSNARQLILQKKIDRFSSSVKYLGPRQDVKELFAIADICVLPSYYREGIPRVLLEAGSLGLPLITTDMPGCRDVVKHEWNGLLVPPRNKWALASAIENLILDTDKRKIMGKRSQRYVGNKFSLEKISREHAELYRELLERKLGRIKPG